MNSFLSAQDIQHLNYSSKNGLPSKEVYDVEFDKQKNLWITTDRGIIKFNSYDFKIFDSKDGLTSNTNFEIFTDNESNLWFSGYDGSITLYNGNIFKKSPLNAKIANLADGNWIQHLYQTYDGRYRFYYSTNKRIDSITPFYEYLTNKDSLIVSYPDTTFNFHYYGDSELPGFIYDSKRKYYLELLSLKNKKLKYFVVNRHVKFFRNDDTLRQNKRESFTSDIYSVDDKGNLNCEKFNFSIRDLLYDSVYNKLFVCSNNGLYSYFLNKNNLEFSNHYFKGHSFSSIAQDYENNYWLTTTDAGLFLVPSFNILTKDFSLTTKNDIRKFGIINNNLLLSSSIGEVFTISRNHDIQKLKTKSNYVPTDFNYTDEFVYLNDGAYILKNKRSITLSKRNAFKNFQRAFLILKNGNAICSNTSDYSIFLNRNNSKRIFYGSVKHRILSFMQDENLDIWICTISGLFKIVNYDYENPLKILDEEKLLSTRINYIHELKKTGIFLATHGNGLLLKRFGRDKVLCLGTKEGLSSDLINRIYMENDSTLWLATNNGLDKLIFEITDSTFTARQIQSITTADGLHSNYIYDVIKWEDEIWVATQSGVNYFKPEDVTIPEYSPPIYFDSIRASGYNILKDSIFELEHHENDLNFHYTGVSYRKPRNKKFYRYSLVKDKQDTSWVYTDDRNIQFTNLERGNYCFVVMARNKYNNWSKNPAEFRFTILPHYTETLWFKLLAGLIILSGLLVLYRSRMKSLERKDNYRRELSNAEFRIKKAELNALRNQMNPHFIYNSLNSIQNFIFQNRPERANFFLSKFSRLMRTSLDMSKLNFIEIGEEVRFLQDYLALEQLRFENKFESTINVSDNVDEELKIPPLMIQPLLENAIKHGFRNLDKGGKLELDLTLEEQGLKIIIQDNGEGIDTSENQNKKHRSYSTSIIKDRIKVINSTLKNPTADLKINHKITKFNKGTYVELILPITE